MKIKNPMMISDLMKLFGIKYFTIGWGQSTVLRNGKDREIISHLLTPLSGIIIIRKKGGYLCYCIYKDMYYHTQWHSYTMDITKGLRDMKKYEGLGCKMYYPEKIRQEIRDYLIMQQL